MQNQAVLDRINAGWALDGHSASKYVSVTSSLSQRVVLQWGASIHAATKDLAGKTPPASFLENRRLLTDDALLATLSGSVRALQDAGVIGAAGSILDAFRQFEEPLQAVQNYKDRGGREILRARRSPPVRRRQ